MASVLRFDLNSRARRLGAEVKEQPGDPIAPAADWTVLAEKRRAKRWTAALRKLLDVIEDETQSDARGAAASDLRRLETAVGWVQRASHQTTLPRATQLPHVEGLPLVCDEANLEKS
jgi:hypothetical protein